MSSSLAPEELDDLIRSVERAPAPRALLLAEGIGYIPIARFAADTPRVYFNAQAELLQQGAHTLVIDLRGCPGGDLEAAYRLGAEFLPSGALLGRVIDADGDATDRVAPRDGPYRYPVVLLVDGATRSAAEAFCGAMVHHGRARVIGGPTFGKTSVQGLVADRRGGASVISCAHFELPL